MNRKGFLFSKNVWYLLLIKAAKQRKLVCFLKLAALASPIISAEVSFSNLYDDGVTSFLFVAFQLFI